MRIIKASTEILAATPDLELLIELAGRCCYKSEDRICDGSAEKLISRLMESKHESVLEHGSITVRFVCDRGVSHELVRHRIASFSQESTRYCNYGKEGFGNEITVIDIRGGFPEMGQRRHNAWWCSCMESERQYLEMLDAGSTPQEARSVLPNSLKTEVVVTANPREWLHIFRLRCDKAAHPQMREVMIPLQGEFQKRWPVIFGVAA
jgi:thymidylate synthase (FAD)